VRCGVCDAAFDALASLFDHWPDTDSAPPGAVAGTPVLGAIAAQTDPPGTSDSTGKTPTDAPPGALHRAWKAAFIVLAVLTVINLAWTFRVALLSQQIVSDTLTHFGWLEATPQAPYRDTNLLHLVSRDLHGHPAREDLLVLSAVFVNRAEQAQPYPTITLTLTGAGNEPLARRSFAPAEYLPAGRALGLLAQLVHVPVLLEFADPGERAIGFELEFE
jgi:hypothetical protein